MTVADFGNKRLWMIVEFIDAEEKILHEIVAVLPTCNRVAQFSVRLVHTKC